MNKFECRESTTPKSSKAATTLEILDLALLNVADLPIQDIPEGLLSLQTCVSGGSDPALSGGYVSRDKCWLCQCPKSTNNCNNENYSEEPCKARVGLLSEFLPWLCPHCEKAMEEEEKRVELSLDSSDSEDSVSNADVCHCDSCKENSHAEEEHEKQTKELQDCWMELSRNIRQVYCLHKEDKQASEDIDVDKLKRLVIRLSARDAHQLYQRLEAQGREVVIDMKVKLLKVLTRDYKTASGAYQFVSMLLEEYGRLCQSCHTVAVFLQPLVEQHLHQFCLTWQLHNKHLFHCIIYTDPVVQKCLPKAVENLRQGLSKSPSDCHMSYSQTLAEYEKFINEMSVISTTWKHCQRLIEKYDEKQAALKVKQKMFKDDWEFFKAQRRLLEQMVPKSKSSSLSCHRFEVQFQQMQKILQSDKEQEYECPNCRQVQCSLDENSISHLITCGIISPEVVKESSNMEPLPHDLSTYLNIKPPSVPSSCSSSGSGSPVILDRERLIVPYGCPYGSDEELAEEPGSDDDDDYHDAELAPPDCGNGQSLASEGQNETGSTQSDSFSLATDADDTDVLEKLKLKEMKPSSSVAKLAFTQMMSDGGSCACHHCKLQNNTLCMFSCARVFEPKQQQFKALLSKWFDPDVCDESAQDEGDKEHGREEGNKHANVDVSLAKLVQNSDSSASLFNSSTSNKTNLSDTLHNLNENSLSKAVHQESHQLLLDSALSLASPLSHICSESGQSCSEGAVDLLHLDEWKTDAFTDQWNGSRHRKSFLLKIPEKQSVDNGILEESSETQKDDAERALPNSTTSSHSAVAAPSVSCQSQSAASAFQSTSSYSKPPSGQNANLGVSQNSANRKSPHGMHANGSSSSSNETLKSTCTKPNQQKQGTNAAQVQCRGAADQNGTCLAHGCERQQQEASENKEESCDRAATSQKDGKHCECWHCEFFGRETPSSIPLSKNYAEMRERLRSQLKKKKEKERMSQKINPDSSQKPGVGVFSSALYNMGVEELTRFINGGCEVNENGKGSRTSSRAASKKSKRQKKSKDNMHDFDVSSNIRSSSETSSSLGSLADSGFSSRERTNSKCMLEADMDRLGLRLTSNPESVGSKEPNSVSARENNSSDKSVQNVERGGMGKTVWAQSAAFKRYKSPTSGTSSSLLHNGETLRTSEILSIEAALADLQNSCLGDTEIKKYSKDIKSAFNTDLSSSCKLNGGPKAIQEESKMKLPPKSASQLASDCSNQKTAMKQIKPADAAPALSPAAKVKKQKRRNRAAGIVIDDVFLPKENSEDVEPEDYDRVVEEFKRFCFSTQPLQKREKLRVPLNLKDIFSRRKSSQGCTS